MEKLIETVLEELRDTNLHSAAGRQAIVKAIMKKIRSGKGFFLNMNIIDGERVPGQTDKEEEAKWICKHCGESTFYVEYDYIGSGTNHLQCDLKETKHFADDFHEGKDGDNDYVYSGDLKDSESKDKTLHFTFDADTGDWVDQHGNREESVEITQTVDMPPPKMIYKATTGDKKDIKLPNLKRQAYNELSADGLPPGGDAQAVRDANKLAEEIAEGSADLGYIFETPDGGETLYRRKVGESERELISKKDFQEYSRNRESVKVNDTKK